MDDYDDNFLDLISFGYTTHMGLGHVTASKLRLWTCGADTLLQVMW